MAQIDLVGVVEQGSYSTDAPNPNVELAGTSPGVYGIEQLVGGIAANGDLVRCTVRKDRDNWAVYSDATYTTGTPNIIDLSAATLEDSKGTISDTDSVEVIGLGFIRAVREILTANRTYYVRTDGSDSNNGLSDTSGGAFLTIQKAIDVAASIDASIYDITIQVGDGTYTGAVVLKEVLGSGSRTLQGNSTTPTNVVISTTSATAITCVNSGVWTVKDLKVQTTTSGGGISVGLRSQTRISGVDFGQCVASHITATDGGSVNATGNYTISGGSSAGGHYYAYAGGAISASGRTVTLSGTPAFASAFAWCDRGLGYFSIFSMTFSGSATGKRYTVNNCGVCFTNGGGSTYLPGSVAGTTATGGQYN